MNNFTLNRYKKLGQEINPEEIVLKQAIRVNTLEITPKELVTRLKKKGVVLEKIPFLKEGYYAEAEFSLSSMEEHIQGFFYIQEAASQIPPIILDPKEEELVLDMAASPGSKTTQMAQMMNNKGQIIALENESLRLKKLEINLERCGITNCIIYHKNSIYCKDLGLEFDKILLDAPCSGNFAADPEWFENIRERGLESIKNNSDLQKKLLRAAISVLKKGGILVYSTCSLEPEENEFNISWLLDEFEGELKIEETELKIGESGLVTAFDKELDKEIVKTKRFWPNKTCTQGFFLAKIKKL